MSEDKALRAGLIKLAHANPDGIREHLLPILKEAAKNAAGKMPEGDQADNAKQALKKVFTEAKLPSGIKWNADATVGTVAVPKGLESLFKTLEVTVSWRDITWAVVSWNYTHPQGGMNGKTIGSISLGPDDKWWWVLETGTRGFIEPKKSDK